MMEKIAYTIILCCYLFTSNFVLNQEKNNALDHTCLPSFIQNLEKVGVYGFVTDAETGDSVLANNPDLSTDAGQFAMIEQINTSDSQVKFEFVAAIPMEKDVSNGIGSLQFDSLRVISYPGGQQFGAIR